MATGDNKMIKLYLDIDGVLLTKKQTRISDNCVEFLEYIVGRFDCYWLTTRCKGDVNSTLESLSGFFDSRSIVNLKKIKPTSWDSLKTEAIDISEEFYWLDDAPLQAEIDYLKKNGVLNRLFIVDLERKDELLNIVSDQLALH